MCEDASFKNEFDHIEVEGQGVNEHVYFWI